MKAFFVNRAINANLVKTKLVAWVDFGYCRSVETLANVKRWQFDFNTKKVHFFSINKRVGKIDSLDKVLDFIFNNRVYIIGGNGRNASKMATICSIITQKSKRIIKNECN